MFNGKNNYVSEYLLGIKDWMIRKMVAGYIDVCEKFRSTYMKANPRTTFPFKDLDEICDMLFVVKEDHHIIFKRVVGRPERIKEEDKHKIDPAQPEINFIANVGRLFHKTLVARELKYLYKHYDPLKNGDSGGASELEAKLYEINELFTEGIEVAIEFMQLHSSNVLLLALIIENSNKLRNSFGIDGIELLKMVTGQNNPEATYFLTGKYYMEGGWYPRAEKIFKKILKQNPKHSAARLALEEVKIKSASPLQA
jgi:hypothetical protein